MERKTRPTHARVVRGDTLLFLSPKIRRAYNKMINLSANFHTSLHRSALKRPGPDFGCWKLKRETHSLTFVTLCQINFGSSLPIYVNFSLKDLVLFLPSRIQFFCSPRPELSLRNCRRESRSFLLFSLKSGEKKIQREIRPTFTNGRILQSCELLLAL